jgi:hypothetical protein
LDRKHENGHNHCWRWFSSTVRSRTSMRWRPKS